MTDDPTALLLKRRYRTRAAAFVALVLILLSILLDRAGAFGYQGNDWSRFDGKSVRVVRVADGDTIVVAGGDGPETRVRLVGVDAPELGDGAYWGDRSFAYARQRLEGRTVTLSLDGTRTRDQYGRLLGYAYVTDGDNFNLDLVRDGQAYADRRSGHSLRSDFESAESDARKKGRGLWAGVRDDQQPAWRVRWLDNRRTTRTVGH